MSPAIVVYDTVLSPVYQVPVLYFGIQDPLHRYPPTMTTLYDHLVVPHFRPQTQDTSTGVIGGISMTVWLNINNEERKPELTFARNIQLLTRLYSSSIHAKLPRSCKLACTRTRRQKHISWPGLAH